MANNWFQFKEFTIQQDKCGMKVSTDACIQGALAADFLSNKKELKSVLDIGTGTGLLSLMLVQKRNDLFIDAIEIEQNSFEQATENFKNSKWNSQLNTHHYAIQDWGKDNEKEYDFIICNPPFFHNHLQSEQKERNAARHTVSLSGKEMIESGIRLLNNTGVFCILFPLNLWKPVEEYALHLGLYLQESISVFPKPNVHPNRIIAFFSKTKSNQTLEKSLIIYDMENIYSVEFKELLKDYYLKL